jgi:hypothetical protein
MVTTAFDPKRTRIFLRIGALHLTSPGKVLRSDSRHDFFHGIFQTLG